MELNKKVQLCQETRLLFPDVSAAATAEVVLKELSFPWWRTAGQREEKADSLKVDVFFKQGREGHFRPNARLFM